MAATNTRYSCSFAGAALISRLSTSGRFCRSVAVRAVRPRSQSCGPMRILSPSAYASDFERWLSTSGHGTGQSKSSLKDWMQYLSRFSPHVDVSSMSRVLTSLHVDLPRNLPEIKRLFPNISLEQLQDIVSRTTRLSRDEEAPSTASRQSNADSKQVPDVTSVDNTKESSSTEVKKTVVHNSQQTEQSISDNVTSTSDNKDDEMKTDAVSIQHKIDSDSATAGADKSRVVFTGSAVPTTDGVMSKFNTVASGIARQIAEYMPTVDTVTPTRSATHPQQKQSHDVSVKEKMKPSEVKKETAAVPKQTTIRRQLVTRGSIDRQTRGLVLCLRDARTSTSQLVRLEELCQHISQYPDCTGVAVKVCLLIIISDLALLTMFALKSNFLTQVIR